MMVSGDGARHDFSTESVMTWWLRTPCSKCIMGFHRCALKYLGMAVVEAARVEYSGEEMLRPLL